MTEVILAMTLEGGIGYNGKLPWYYKEELEIFNAKTMGKILVMGRKTMQNLPKFEKFNRHFICITRDPMIANTESWNIQPDTILTPETINFSSGNHMIAGGADIYEMAFDTPNLVQKVHLSIIKEKYKCDTYFNIDLLDDFVITETKEYDNFFHYVLEPTNHGERQYLHLIEDILCEGDRRQGRNGFITSIFKNDMTFDLRNGFPLLTTKKMFLRGILEEFLFFIKGETDSNILTEKKVYIWSKNTSKAFLDEKKLPYQEGVMGPMYGYQWRYYNATYKVDKNGYPLKTEEGIDQIANVISMIKNDPTSRRIMLTVYNPCQVKEGVLYPCHSIIIQFYVSGNMLDMFCYNRSQDVGLGVPFNIASSSLLLMIIAKITNKIPRYFHMTMGDTHIYQEHEEALKDQMIRIPYKFPKLIIPNIKNLDDLNQVTEANFKLVDYNYHPKIHMEMKA